MRFEVTIRRDIIGDEMREIYFAGGCFWGVEEYFSRIPGVVETKTGYANSVVESPSYEMVCTGRTEAAEAVQVQYEEEKVSLRQLLEKYFSIIDPTLINRQGFDMGTQYRTGIYTLSEEDFQQVREYVEEIKPNYRQFMTEVGELQNFYPAEEYHQHYLKKNPGGYCHIPLD